MITNASSCQYVLCRFGVRFVHMFGWKKKVVGSVARYILGGSKRILHVNINVIFLQKQKQKEQSLSICVSSTNYYCRKCTRVLTQNTIHTMIERSREPIFIKQMVSIIDNRVCLFFFFFTVESIN